MTTFRRKKLVPKGRSIYGDGCAPELVSAFFNMYFSSASLVHRTLGVRWNKDSKDNVYIIIPFSSNGYEWDDYMYVPFDDIKSLNPVWPKLRRDKVGIYNIWNSNRCITGRCWSTEYIKERPPLNVNIHKSILDVWHKEEVCSYNDRGPYTSPHRIEEGPLIAILNTDLTLNQIEALSLAYRGQNLKIKTRIEDTKWADNIKDTLDQTGEFNDIQIVDDGQIEPRRIRTY